MKINQSYNRSDAHAADRRGHYFIIGPLDRRIETSIIDAIKDIQAGHGVCFIDIDGKASPMLLDSIPARYTREVVYWEFVRSSAIGFNLLEHQHKDDVADIANSISATFEDIWGSALIGPRTVQLLTNGIVSLADLWRKRHTPSLYSLIKFYSNSEYRNYVVKHTTNAETRAFWIEQFTNWEKDQKFLTQAIAPLQNKLSYIFSNTHLKSTFSQNTSSISLQLILNNSNIFIIDLKNLISDNAILFLSLFLPQFYFAIKRRAEQTNKLTDIFLYIPDLGDIGNRLGIPQRVLDYLLRNTENGVSLTIGSKSAIHRKSEFDACESILSFKCGSDDIALLESEFGDLGFTNRKIAEHFIYTHSVVGRFFKDGMYGNAFWGNMSELEYRNYDKKQSIIRHSYNRYYRSRSRIERKLSRFHRRWTIKSDGVNHEKNEKK